MRQSERKGKAKHRPEWKMPADIHESEEQCGQQTKNGEGIETNPTIGSNNTRTATIGARMQDHTMPATSIRSGAGLIVSEIIAFDPLVRFFAIHCDIERSRNADLRLIGIYRKDSENDVGADN